jgi:cytochrome P450
LGTPVVYLPPEVAVVTTAASPSLSLVDTAFWSRPLQERMDDLAALRAGEPLPVFWLPNPLTGEDVRFRAVTRYADVVEISKQPKLYCSGQGSVSIPDMPPESMEYFGSFITMDDPRHARQRGIVARSFTPRRLNTVVDSVERICEELIDGFCEEGEADLAEVLSAPFPLLVICDMMGVPRSEFRTVLDATNVILGGGDPEFIGDRDFLTATIEAGMTLTALMGELAESRRAEPADDLTSDLVNADIGEDMMTPEELGAFFILLAVAGNDTTRTATSLGMTLLAANPDQRARWLEDLDGRAGHAVEEIVRMASPVTFMRRTTTGSIDLAGVELEEGERLILFYGAANRDPDVFAGPDRFDISRDPNPHVGFGGPGPHFCLGAHLARRELAIAFRHLLSRLPDIDVAGDPVFLEPLGVPLVSGVKRLPVRFTPTARRG